jgi:hypothetical protein
MTVQRNIEQMSVIWHIIGAKAWALLFKRGREKSTNKRATIRTGK